VMMQLFQFCAPTIPEKCWHSPQYCQQSLRSIYILVVVKASCACVHYPCLPEDDLCAILEGVVVESVTLVKPTGGGQDRAVAMVALHNVLSVQVCYTHNPVLARM